MSAQGTPLRPAAADESRLLAFATPSRAARLRTGLVVVAAVLVLIYAGWMSDVFSGKLITGLPKLGDALALMLRPSGFEHLPEFLWALAETIAMAFLGTLLGATVAVPLALVCARSTMAMAWLQFGFRRLADSLRTFDHLIWALVFVRAVGLGPLAGIMAIALVDAGTLAKLYAEALDNVSRQPVEGVRSAGGTWLDGLRLGLLPQVLPNILSTTLYLWESNTRSATILGIVGAGGIGYQLADRLRVYEFGQATVMIVLIVLAVTMIDTISAWLRRRLVAPPQR